MLAFGLNTYIPRRAPGTPQGNAYPILALDATHLPVEDAVPVDTMMANNVAWWEALREEVDNGAHVRYSAHDENDRGNMDHR